MVETQTVIGKQLSKGREGQRFGIQRMQNRLKGDV